MAMPMLPCLLLQLLFRQRNLAIPVRGVRTGLDLKKILAIHVLTGPLCNRNKIFALQGFQVIARCSACLLLCFRCPAAAWYSGTRTPLSQSASVAAQTVMGSAKRVNTNKLLTVTVAQRENSVWHLASSDPRPPYFL